MSEELKVHKKEIGQSGALCGQPGFKGIPATNWMGVTCGNCLRLRTTPTGSWIRRFLWRLFG